MRRAFFLSILMFGCSSLFALDNGLARTPPMGWNSWNKFACNVSEEPDPRSRRRHGEHAA